MTSRGIFTDKMLLLLLLLLYIYICICSFKWRSPEEYSEQNVDEKIDGYSLGDKFFSLLTGLEPFWEEEDWDRVRERIKMGEKAPRDPRYRERGLPESNLVEVIHWCHEFDPQKRPCVFDVVQFLRDAMEELDAVESKEVHNGSVVRYKGNHCNIVEVVCRRFGWYKSGPKVIFVER
jgi:serine/threonine protein kinase